MDERLSLNIVFIGASKFGLRCLDLCINSPEISIVGIITAPKNFTISYKPLGVTNVLFADMAEKARAENIPFAVLQESMNDFALYELVKNWRPNAFIVAGWYHKIPKSWLALAPAYGLHASLLPDYSGGAPLVWAMIKGESKTGITLFQMDDGVDSGPIVSQAEEAIYNDDTIATIYSRIEDAGLELLRKAIPTLAEGTLNLVQQDESKRRTYPQRSPEDGLIDWGQDAVQIDRFIRAQTRPYPGAFSILSGNLITIWAAELDLRNQGAHLGCIERMNDSSYRVVCRSGGIVLKEISYKEEIYIGAEIAELLGDGGQRLGAMPK